MKTTIFAAFMLAAVVPLQATELTVGVNDNPNCYPFGCSAQFHTTTYQEVYDSSLFSGPVEIENLAFFYGSGVGTVVTADYLFAFSTTPAAVGSLSLNLASNIGPDQQMFYQGQIGGLYDGSVLSISGSPFYYDPAQGNLLLTIYLANGSGFGAFFEGVEQSTVSSRAFNGDFGVADNQALVTRFGYNEVTQTPEPGTFAAVALALLGLGALRRRSVE